jgi:uncharacterized protein
VTFSGLADITALIQRDVRDIADIEKQNRLPRFLRALAQMAGQLCNYTKLGGQVGLDSKTASKYMSVLEHMFLIRRIEPLSTLWGRKSRRAVDI